MSTPTADLLAELAEIGRDPVRGGYSRPGLGEAELELRSWFIEQATRRGLEVELDRNGIVWAWWLPASGDRAGAVITGSHLDSVPGGGAYDGPLGVVSALRAFDLLREANEFPARPLALVVFPEEEGSRFGVPCLGSRLASGALTPERARSLADADGVTFPDAARAAGIDPDAIGPTWSASPTFMPSSSSTSSRAAASKTSGSRLRSGARSSRTAAGTLRFAAAATTPARRGCRIAKTRS